VGSRLPRRYNEASFIFATCTALAVRYSRGDLESGENLESGHTLFFEREKNRLSCWSHTLFFTRTPKPNGTAGNRWTAPIAQESKVRKGKYAPQWIREEGKN
jgi:hypothetical protein